VLQLNGVVPFAALWKGVKGCLTEDVGTISSKPLGFEFLANASARCPDTMLEARTKW
jgi:hypothetical protein